MLESPTPRQILAHPLTLPCGAVLKNRLAKSAMSDSLADGTGDPTATQITLYQRWAQGGIALSIIGEMQGDPRFPEKPGNLVLGKHSNRQGLEALVSQASINGSHLWSQLGHAGALSHPPISHPQGPSVLNVSGIKCAAMSVNEVSALPEMYAQTATLAMAAGFSGVQIHAAHGFLLSQFLSPLFNHRKDDYGGSIKSRCRVVIKVINKVRDAVGKAFPIGVKINATDMLEGGLTQEESLEIIAMLNDTSVDLIEISAGTYFPGAKATAEGASGGPYFLSFAKRARLQTDKPLMLTGGFKTRQQAVDALASGATDIVGLARAMVLAPRLPDTWLEKSAAGPVFPKFPAAPAGGITAWYTMRLSALGENKENAFSMTPQTALSAYEKRDAQRCVRWRKKFPTVLPE